MSRIPDLTFFHPGSYLFKSRYLICIKEFKYFKYSIENIIRVVDPRSRIRLQILAIPDPGSWGQKATGPWIPNPDPESGSATLQKVL
jgi:hypothetical protein